MAIFSKLNRQKDKWKKVVTDIKEKVSYPGLRDTTILVRLVSWEIQNKIKIFVITITIANRLDHLSAKHNSRSLMQIFS